MSRPTKSERYYASGLSVTLENNRYGIHVIVSEFAPTLVEAARKLREKLEQAQKDLEDEVALYGETNP